VKDSMAKTPQNKSHGKTTAITTGIGFMRRRVAPKGVLALFCGIRAFPGYAYVCCSAAPYLGTVKGDVLIVAGGIKFPNVVMVRMVAQQYAGQSL
jgi:hypothetical protein